MKLFRRRGFQPGAIVNMLRDIGANPNDISIDIRNLSAYNKKIVDAKANRHTSKSFLIMTGYCNRRLPITFFYPLLP